MRAFQVPQVAQALRAVAGRWRGPRGSVRCVIGVIGGVVWWGAVLGLVIRPDGAGSWQGVIAAGWSLGLIPLHAVPARRKAQAPAGAGPRWQLGHQ